MLNIVIVLFQANNFLRIFLAWLGDLGVILRDFCGRGSGSQIDEAQHSTVR